MPPKRPLHNSTSPLTTILSTHHFSTHVIMTMIQPKLERFQAVMAFFRALIKDTNSIAVISKSSEANTSESTTTIPPEATPDEAMACLIYEIPTELRQEIFSHVSQLVYRQLKGAYPSLHWSSPVLPTAVLQTSQQVHAEAVDSVRLSSAMSPATIWGTFPACLHDVPSILRTLRVALSIDENDPVFIYARNNGKPGLAKSGLWARYLERRFNGGANKLMRTEMWNIHKFFERTVTQLQRTRTLDVRIIIPVPMDGQWWQFQVDNLCQLAKGAMAGTDKEMGYSVTMVVPQGWEVGSYWVAYIRDQLEKCEQVKWTVATDEEMKILPSWP